MTTTQFEVLKRIEQDAPDLSEAFNWFRCSHGHLPFMVDDRAFTKVLEALQRRKLVELVDGYYRVTDAGRGALAAGG